MRTIHTLIRIKIIFTALIYFCLIGLHANAQETTQKLTVVNNDWPPFAFGGKLNEPKGLANELMELCLPSTGYPFHFQFYPIQRMHAYIESGDIDVNTFSYKKERESFLYYGKEPLFSSGYRPVVLKENPVKIQTLQDFDRLTLGHLNGLKYSTEFLKYVEERDKNKRLVTATSEESLLKMMLFKRIDIFVDTQESILWRAKQMEVLDKIKILDYDIKTSHYFLTVSKQTKIIKNPEEFLNQFDQCVKTAKADGTYQRILQHYGN